MSEGSTAFVPEAWAHTQYRRNFQDLPTEVLIEIFTQMGWKDILACRKTCKHLFEISTARPLWMFLFERLSNESLFPPILERPLSVYTAEYLELIVQKRILSEAAFAIGQPSRVRTVAMKFDDAMDHFHLLEGGRWLLITSPSLTPGCVYAYDLDNSFPQEPRCIIDLGVRDPYQEWWINVDVDKNESCLAFNLCLAPSSDNESDDVLEPSMDSPSANFYVYRLTLDGHGSKATLVAHRLRTIYAGLGPYTRDLAFQGDYVARLFGDAYSDECYIEICNWFLSDSSSCAKSYIVSDQLHEYFYQHEISLLPGGKFLLVSDASISLYDITTLHKRPPGKEDKRATLQPYWCFEDPYVDTGIYLSKPYSDVHANATRIAIGLNDTIHGLITRRDNKDPWFEPLCETDLTYKMGFLGINKTYDLGHFSEAAHTSFIWPGDEEQKKALIPPAVHSVIRPVSYERIVNPMFDECSNRVFIQGADTWTIVDY